MQLADHAFFQATVAAGDRLRDLIGRVGVTVAPGVFDATSARLTADAGFAMAYASGGSIVRSFGLPDLGLADPSMMAERFRQIASIAGIPILADADAGFGNALNVYRVLRMYEEAGVAGVHIEDQVSPKRCGHYEGVALVPVEEMAEKIKAATEARRHPSTVIVARTDAFAQEGLSEAIHRAGRYADAGADMIFVEGISSAHDLERVANAITLPKVLNCGVYDSAEARDPVALADWGFRILIYPADLQCAAIAGMADRLSALRDQASLCKPPSLSLLEVRDGLVNLTDWLALAGVKRE